MHKYFQLGEPRKLTRWWKTLVTLIGVVLAFFEIWTALFVKLDPWLHRSVFLTFILILTFIVYSPIKSSQKKMSPSYIDIFLAIMSTAAGVYFVLNAERFITRWPQVDPMSFMDLFFGLFVFLMVLEITRRTVGFPLLVMISIFLVYSFFGQYFPAGFSHRGMTIVRFVDQTIYTLDGVFGTPIGVTSTMVYMFVLFGAILEKSGASDFFFKMASALAGRSVGGPAKVAVISSGLYGSISGSPTSNVVTTGTFTIPLMKRIGYSPVFAGAVEAAASTGGGILPPVMGSAAFLMVEFTGISYLSIIKAAAIPGVLYYIAILLQVHLRALAKGMQPMEKGDIESPITVLKKYWFFLLPFILLVWLLFKGYTPTFAGAIVSFSTIAVSWLRRETRMGVHKIIESFEEAALSIIVVTSACAAAGLVIAGIMFTGMGNKFTSLIFGVAGGFKLVVMFFTAIVCILLGMGMPVPSAYVLTAAMAGPALLQVGLPLMQSHLFIVYFATLSAITPPVAVAAYAASGLANANPNQIGFQAMRLAFVGFLIPFFFVFQPLLLMDGNFGEIILAFLTAFMGVVALAIAMEGWFYEGISGWGRLILLFAGLILIYPGVLSDLTGIALLCLVLSPQMLKMLGRKIQRPVVDRSNKKGSV